jgi:N utilization substance protein A
LNLEWLEALRQIEREKGIDSETVIQALEAALLSAYKKNYTTEEEARVEVNRETGSIHVFAIIEEEGEGESREEEVTPRNFGRIAAQTAKQVILQRIREAERDLMFDEYHEKVGDIVTGIVQQSDQRYTLVDLGKVEALLPTTEQIQGERYKHGMRLKVYIVEVRKTSKGPQILVSRTHPGLLKRLFELEVPEIAEGYVEIKAVAREPGHRSKIAVVSHDRNIDPVGACVGARGSRVRMVVNELKGEKVDIIPWKEDQQEFVSNALSPAKVKEVFIFPDEELSEVIVPDSQLSLAIGKEGQNARLAAKLTGWRIDIKSESQARDEHEGYTVHEIDDEEAWRADEEEAASIEAVEDIEESTDGSSEPEEVEGEIEEGEDVADDENKEKE